MGVGKEVCAPADTEFPSHWAARLTVRRKGNNAAGEAQATCTFSSHKERVPFLFDCFNWEGDNDDFDQLEVRTKNRHTGCQ